VLDADRCRPSKPIDSRPPAAFADARREAAPASAAAAAILNRSALRCVRRCRSQRLRCLARGGLPLLSGGAAATGRRPALP
jgi:hypothetical protein